MNKILLIIKREYFTRVKKKSFIIMTILGPLLMAGMMIGAVMIGMSETTNHDVLVIDYNGVLSQKIPSGERLVSRFPRRFEDSDRMRYHFTREDMSNDEFTNSHYTLMIKLDDQTLNDGKSTLTYKKLPSLSVKESIKSEVQSALEEWRVLEDLNLKYEDYKRMKVKISFLEIDIDNIGEASTKQEQAIVGFIFAIIIYMFIFIYGVQVMKGVIEEKTNRIVEVLISSVKPFQLMMGKIIGIGMVGLTQFLIWVILSMVFVSIGQGILFSMIDSPAAMMEAQQSMTTGGSQEVMDLVNSEVYKVLANIPWTLLIFTFIFFFLGGFLLYGSLFAAIGSAVDSETDTQQFMLPVSLPLIFGFVVTEFMLQNPEGDIGFWFSLIPFTSPIVIMVKTAMGYEAGTIWQLFLSMFILIVTFVFIVWMAGKIYRTGILMYGKKASYKELWKWLFYKA